MFRVKPTSAALRGLKATTLRPLAGAHAVNGRRSQSSIAQDGQQQVCLRFPLLLTPSSANIRAIYSYWVPTSPKLTLPSSTLSKRFVVSLWPARFHIY